MTPPRSNPAIDRIQNKITLAEVGVVFSLLISVLTGAFTFGVLYGQVAENTKFRESAMRDMMEQREDIASIKTSVEYLVGNKIRLEVEQKSGE